MTPEQRRLCIEVLGWNQTQFARFIDRDPSTVRRWFTGAREPDLGIDLWLLRRARDMVSDDIPGRGGIVFREFRETMMPPSIPVTGSKCFQKYHPS